MKKRLQKLSKIMHLYTEGFGYMVHHCISFTPSVYCNISPYVIEQVYKVQRQRNLWGVQKVYQGTKKRVHLPLHRRCTWNGMFFFDNLLTISFPLPLRTPDTPKKWNGEEISKGNLKRVEVHHLRLVKKACTCKTPPYHFIHPIPLRSADTPWYTFGIKV